MDFDGNMMRFFFFLGSPHFNAVPRFHGADKVPAHLEMVSRRELVCIQPRRRKILPVSMSSVQLRALASVVRRSSYWRTFSCRLRHLL